MTAVLALTTGGTIDKVYTAKGDLNPGPSCLPDVLAEAFCHLEVDVVEVVRKDSLDMTAADRDVLRQRVVESGHDRILITHGTDTIIETAQALTGVPGKTIVLTAAMQPRSFRRSDAAFNVGFALAALSLLPPGVYVAIHGKILDPQRIRKDREQGAFVPLHSAAGDA